MERNTAKRMLEKLLSVCICLCMLGAMLPAQVFAEEADNAQTETVQDTAPKGTVYLSSADDLIQLAKNCRLDSWSQNRTVVLEADINLSGADFNGIPSFGGTWEGQNHAITGLSLSQDGSVQGLFRYVQQGALVRDMTVKGRIKPGGTRASIGGIAGNNAGTIENCAFDGVVSGTSQIGGIAGVNTVKGSINGCTVSGTVYGSHFVGGVVGQNDGVAANCTNAASVNTTVSQNEVKLNDLTLDDVLKTEKANDVTDAGGIAGNNAGVLRACINRGTIGYSHIGYNVGGIAGSQTGYVEGCVNYGTVNARKEGGGIVGQMEPSSVLQYNQDTLQELQGELDTLSALMNKATNDASASSSELTSQLNDLTGRVDSAREAVDTLIDKTVNGFDIGTQTINITNLTKLTGQGTINGSGNGSASGSGNGNINGTIELVPTPEPTEEPEETPEPTETPAATQAPAVTEAPTAAPDPDPTAAPAPEPDQPDDQPAEQSEDDREGEAHGRPRRNEPTFDVDLDFGGEGGGDAGGDVTIDHGGEGQIDSNIDLTVPSITLSDRDSITAARSSLNGSLASIIDGVSSLNTNTGSHTQALIQDVQAISSQLNKIGDTLAGAADQSEDDNNLFEDVSDSDTDGDTEGKVFNCMNLGEVNADINAGGITGAMARENDLDPEDDTKTSGSSSLNVTYKTRIVVRDCINKGAVNVKKKGGGGIVGSMDMGSVLQSYNFGNLESDDADYVGGIAGQSKSIIRRSAAKCRLSGDNYVGGIAGSGFTITGSRSFVLADGDEYVGAIAGGLESSNSITNLNSALQDSESEQSGNYFVSETLGGIDGVSYAGQAEPLSFQEFCDLTAQEGMPDEFRNVTLNFVASQVTVAAVTVEYGAAFDMANAPELPAKGGYTAEWSDFDHDHVVFDQTIEAVYTPLDSVVQSGDTRNGLPILLAEGAFGTAEVTLTPSSESPGAVGTLLECWDITLPADRSDSHVLHYLAPSDNTVVYLRDADGSWRKVDTTEDGSYLVFTAMTDETTLAAVEKPGIPLPILIGGAVAAVLLVILSILGHKHRKKRLAEKAEQERKRAEKTDNGWFY